MKALRYACEPDMIHGLAIIGDPAALTMCNMPFKDWILK